MDPGNQQVLSDAPRTMALSEELHALPPPEAAGRLKNEPDEIAARALALLNPAEVVDVLAHLSPERRARIIAAAPGGRGEQWGIDLQYPETSVGRLMERPLAVYGTDTTVGEAIESLRELVQKAFITYIFVTDSDRRLVGVLAFRELLFAKPRAASRRDHAARPLLAQARHAARRRHAHRRDAALSRPTRCATTPAAWSAWSAARRCSSSRPSRSAPRPAAWSVSRRRSGSATPWSRSLRFRHPWLQLNLLTAFVAAAVVGDLPGHDRPTGRPRGVPAGARRPVGQHRLSGARGHAARHDARRAAQPGRRAGSS